MGKNQIYLYNETEEKIESLKTIEKVLKSALAMENLKGVCFSVIFVDSKRIQQINQEYRKQDRETDVISFALEEDRKVLLPGKKRILGDIYICLNRAKKQAIQYEHSLERELCFLAVHGLYHLLGYDHETKEEEKVMFQKQEEVLEKNKVIR